MPVSADQAVLEKEPLAAGGVSPFFFSYLKQWLTRKKRYELLTQSEDDLPNQKDSVAMLSEKDLTAMEQSTQKVSGLGKGLAGLRGFIQGAYTIISLALIGISFTVIGGVALGAILTPYVVIPILAIALVVGVIIATNRVKKEKAEQQKQADFIEISKKPTDEYNTRCAINENKFVNDFHKAHETRIQEFTAEIKKAGEDAGLTKEEVDALISSFNEKYARICNDAKDKFIATKNSVNTQVVALNLTPAPALSFKEKLKKGWKIFKTKLPKWGSLVRNPIGIFEGTAILAGGTFFGTAESLAAGTGFTTAAGAGVAAGAAVLAVGAAVTHEKVIVAPRKKNITRLEAELKIKVEAANKIKMITPMAYGELCQTKKEILEGVDRVKDKKTIAAQQAEIVSLKKEALAAKENAQSFTPSSPPGYSSPLRTPLGRHRAMSA